jgi:hypothetical protein
MTFRPDTVLLTDADLEEFWRELMGPLGFARRALWIAFATDDGRLSHQLVEIGDLPRTPSPQDCDGFADLLSGLHQDTGVCRFAFLLVRPGPGGAARDDRTWAAALHPAVHAAGVRCEPVPLATDTRLVPLPVDDLDLVAS